MYLIIAKLTNKEPTKMMHIKRRNIHLSKNSFLPSLTVQHMFYISGVGCGPQMFTLLHTVVRLRMGY